jgi:GGDEF domain-containing protein
MTAQDLATESLTGSQLLAHLDREIDLARAEGGHYAIVACVPRRFDDEDVAAVMEAVLRCIRQLVRDRDVTGVLDADTIIAGLPDTDPTQARVFAHRVQADLGLRSYHLRNTIWDAGVASLGVDGTTTDELVPAAAVAARTRRRRLAG